jgi:hypothetical protein
MEKYRGLRTVDHSRGDCGIAANLVRFPDRKPAIALLCNSDAINPIVLTQKIADIYLAGSPGLTPAAVSAPPQRGHSFGSRHCGARGRLSERFG